jgi:mono/diheme cytochrome c family protein
MKKIISTIFVIIILAAAGGAYFIFSGTYNVAATNQDPEWMNWALSETREQSIERRSEDVIPPADTVLNDPKTIREGYEHYNEMCVVCHGAPGVEAGEARQGLNPKPPLLAKVAGGTSVREMFWVIKHGIKMTGMPAWGPTHSDDKIWSIVAFVKKLPGMSPEEYKAMAEGSVPETKEHVEGAPVKEIDLEHPREVTRERP